MDPAAPQGPETAQRTLLVVDDEEAILRILGQWVEHLGHRVRTAASADAAIRELERGDIAAALCDIRMPGKDGIWLAGQIRERFPRVGVVLVTGLDELDAGVTLRPGIVGYVTKPFRRDTISSAIQDALEWHDEAQDDPRDTRESLMDLVNRWEPQESA